MTRKQQHETFSLRTLMERVASTPARPAGSAEPEHHDAPGDVTSEDTGTPVPATAVPAWPPVAARPGVNATHEQYVRAHDGYTAQLKDVMDHLRATLGPDEFSAVERAVIISSLQTWTSVMANGTRHHQSSDFSRTNTRVYARNKHVQSRLKERFGLHLTERQVSELARQWQALPSIRINKATVMRRVAYRGHEIHAIYELLDTGTQELCTVLNPATADSEAAAND